MKPLSKFESSMLFLWNFIIAYIGIVTLAGMNYLWRVDSLDNTVLWIIAVAGGVFAVILATLALRMDKQIRETENVKRGSQGPILMPFLNLID